MRPMPSERPEGPTPPDWAVDEATGELSDGEGTSAVAERAWDLVAEAAEREAERHDEYDDPDQGGEA